MNTEFPSALVVLHSQAPNKEELITLEVELHRWVLAELNTHRSFSRNFQSSRAMPISKMIEQVRTDPALPVYWGSNKRGMTAGVEIDTLVVDNAGKEFSKLSWWGLAADTAASSAEAMERAGYSKEIVNRLLEPFMKTKGIITATRDAFNKFFLLRSHKDAQPEIRLLSDRMKLAIENSQPQELKLGQYHLPYVKQSKIKSLGITNSVKTSTSCNAQVSFRALDDSLEKALSIYNMLNLPVSGVYQDDPPHYSPTEHIALITDEYHLADHFGILEQPTLYCSGNFQSKTFWQYRKALEDGDENLFLTGCH